MLVVNGELVAVAEARARPRGRRRHAHHRGAGRDRQQRPAPRHRPREGADAPRARPPGRAPAGAARPTPARPVPPAGEVVYLRSTGNLSTGGTAIDVTDVVHPDNREMAVRAVKAIGLDVGGVDFLTPDITAVVPRGRRRDLRGQRGAGLPHARGAERGHAARRGRAGDRHALPARHAGAASRSPPSPAPTARPPPSRMLAHILKLAGAHGRAHHHRRRLHRRRAHGDGRHDRPDRRADGAARPAVDVAVLETARGGLLRAGMGYRHCDVARCST